MKQTRARLAVFGNIVWPEFGERIVAALRHNKIWTAAA
jgi:hypothetical protein